jgi:phosphopentomutase/2,3-bisphosphoglycerate-independent phosphoglycerate mutase family metalloenzyme
VKGGCLADRLSFMLVLVLCFGVAPQSSWGQQLKTRNVVLIVTDGLRWQEVFTGADSNLLNEKSGGIWESAEKLRHDYWNDDPVERRKMLFPFLWNVVAKQGQIFGNQKKGSYARVTNGLAFSYPGYNEMLTGHPDPRINSNEFGPNPNTTVFEWMNQFPEFHGQVAVYATWDVFKNIFNQPRSQLVMQVGWDLPEKGNLTPRQELLNDLYRTTTRLDDEDVWDSFLQVPLLDYVKSAHPRLLFVGYGETDNWAHAGRYDLVLESAHQFDGFVRQLWDTMQAMPEYRDQTTFIITTDHGRGSGLEEWKEHGVDQKGSDNIWIAVMGPDTTRPGELENTGTITQSEIAATIGEFLGKDFQHALPDVAPPLPLILSRTERPLK